jgi:S-adenosylmethionine uptake transporter
MGARVERPADLPLAAFAVAVIGVGALSAMDAAMKSLSLAHGAFSALTWRSLAAALLVAIPYSALRKAWPSRTAMRLHVMRGVIMVPMSFLFFWGLARVPIAQAIALAFVAPLLALGLAALILHEPIGRRMLGGSALAFAGVLLIFAGQAQADLGRDALLGSLAILGSAAIYAFNIILMRQQALQARPLEIAFFQFSIGAAGFWLVALLAGVPAFPTGEEGSLAWATGLSIAGMLLLAWAYARAGAAYLATTEYTGFLWAMLFGWIFFAERVSPFTLAGAALIVGGCILAARKPEDASPAMETAA